MRPTMLPCRPRLAHLFIATALIVAWAGSASACVYYWWFPRPDIQVSISGWGIVCPQTEVSLCAYAMDLDHYQRYTYYWTLIDEGDARDEIDPNGYRWEASGGTFTGDLTTACVTWHAPIDPGVYQITCYANDIPFLARDPLNLDRVWPPDIGSHNDPEGHTTHQIIVAGVEISTWTLTMMGR